MRGKLRITGVGDQEVATRIAARLRGAGIDIEQVDAARAIQELGRGAAGLSSAVDLGPRSRAWNLRAARVA